ncbi:acid protease [Calocera cornea HHB12733]|uniref:Acid protease n=1 Tax=Calocera cornea HHB12733 TaxID=1353952 RepID=A0A165HPF7_9BASI|nr:acid protease [Calocera cornea HHB12733]
MHLLPLLALPLLASALPLSHSSQSKPHHPRTGSSIPLSKTFTLTLPSGLLNLNGLLTQLSYLNTKYSPPGSLGLGLDTSKLEAKTGLGARGRKGRRQNGQEGGVGMTDYKDLMWYGPVSVGSEGQTFMLDFDTGSADMFLAGSTCPNCGNHTLYNPSSSSTSTPTSQNFTLKYGDGSQATGMIYRDTVTIGGMTAQQQAVGAASYETGSFSRDVTSGLLGLAYPSLSAFNDTPFFSTLMAQGTPDSGVFAFKLSDTGSELWLGGSDAPFVQGPIDWTPVTKQKYWEVGVDALRVGYEDTAAGNFSAIIDTGTTLVIGDSARVGAFYALIPGAKEDASVGSGFYSFPCNASLPGITLEFANASQGRPWEIDPEMFNLGPVRTGSSDCLGGIVSQGNYPFWIVGDVFLKGKSVLFDMDRNRFGVAGIVQ